MKIFINEYKYDEKLKKIIPADVNKNQTDVQPWRLKAFVKAVYLGQTIR